jgi:hypothetical protein
MTVETKPVNETIVGSLGETSGIVEIPQMVANVRGNIVIGLVGNVVIELRSAPPIKHEKKSKKDPDFIR